MAEIAKKEALKIGDARSRRASRSSPRKTGKNVAKLRVEYASRRSDEMLIGMILENKVLDIIEAKAKIGTSEGT